MLYGGVHIKEAFARRMAVKDEVAYIGLKETDSHLQLYKCMMNTKDFQEPLNTKLTRLKTGTHDNVAGNKVALREYLKPILSNIAEHFGFTVVTDIDKDHLMTVQGKDALFVYFGAMTAKLIHVACWLQIPKSNGKIDQATNPKIFFWVLHTSYAQELEALGDLEEIKKDEDMHVDQISNIMLVFDQGIDYVK